MTSRSSRRRSVLIVYSPRVHSWVMPVAPCRPANAQGQPPGPWAWGPPCRPRSAATTGSAGILNVPFSLTAVSDYLIHSPAAGSPSALPQRSGEDGDATERAHAGHQGSEVGVHPAH